MPTIEHFKMRFKLNTNYLALVLQQDPTIHAVYTDGTYIVERHETSNDVPFCCRLVIRCEDKAPIRTWREHQDIKNEIAGDDAIAIEVYPRESEVTDTANLYHLWVLRDDVKIAACIVPRQF